VRYDRELLLLLYTILLRYKDGQKNAMFYYMRPEQDRTAGGLSTVILYTVYVPK